MTDSASLSHTAAVEALEQSWRPRPWRAAILSLLAPFAGQLYNGRPRRALATVIALQLWLVIGIAASLVAPGRLLRIALLLLLILMPVAIVPWDAWRIARVTGTTRQRWYQRWYVLLALLALWALAVQPQIFDGVRQYLTEAYRIPAGGMAPTLAIGDYVLVSKWDNAAAARGDVVVFSDASGRNYVQRVVGLPGDTLAMRDHALLVNGSSVPEPYAHNTPGVDPADAEFEWQRRFLVTTQDTSNYQPTLGNWGPLVVPLNHYFLVGDNRGSSYDSRYRGFVSGAQIRGRARWVYFSRSGGDPIAWSRIGVGIR
jgi:signal peptidase I